MKKSFAAWAVLLAITLVASLALGLTNAVTKEPIARQAETAMATAAEYNKMNAGKDHITMPYVADDAVVAAALKAVEA